MSAEKKSAPARSRRSPWYGNGLRFGCQPDCGRCCTRHGEYGYVYLDAGDQERLAAHFQTTTAEFRKRWTRRDDGHVVLRMEEAACPLLDGTLCTVYDARPSQCRTFPFWPDNLRTPSHWERLTEFCPGIGNGDIVPLHMIRDRLAGRESA